MGPAPEKSNVHNLMIGLLFVAIVLSPCVMAALSGGHTDEN